jgi:hypothetical protein
LDHQVSLESLAAGTREERGTYLQQALRTASAGNLCDEVAAACAFLATQIAPGSLEHLEVLRGTGSAAVVLWYAMYAALQSPNEILSTQNGVGHRVLRDIAREEKRMSRPSADIAYSELKALERLGLESMARKFGHVGEVEVELVPFVTSSFSYHPKGTRPRSDSEFKAQEHLGGEGVARKLGHIGMVQAELVPFMTTGFIYSNGTQTKFDRHGQQLTLETEGYGTQRFEGSPKAIMVQMLSVLTQLALELPDIEDNATPPGQRKSRKR